MPSQPEPTTSGSRINPADWGPWRLNPNDAYLEHSTEDYPIDLVTIARDSAEMLDMIMQVAGKSPRRELS